METITISRRFRGTQNTGQGGYVCGMLACRISGAAEVTLRAPPPLETELVLSSLEQACGSYVRTQQTIAIGRAITLDIDRPERATYAEAAAAEKRTPIKPNGHPFPMCFGCGSDRAVGDGLRLYAGPLVPRKDRGAFAVPWMPDPSLAAVDGLIAPEFVWSALECPAAHVWVYDENTGGNSGLAFVLGRLSLRIDRRPRPGEQCIVTSWRSGSEGRRMIADMALFGEDESVLAVGRAILFVVDPEVQFNKKV